MISHEMSKNEALRTKTLLTALRSHWLSAGMQTVLDLSILLSAFVMAYLLRFDLDLPEKEVNPLLTQIPFVVLLQFVALSLTGGRSAIWRYTGMDHIRPFLYAALGSLFVIAILRLQLSDAYHAWRVPLSV